VLRFARGRLLSGPSPPVGRLDRSGPAPFRARARAPARARDL